MQRPSGHRPVPPRARCWRPDLKLVPTRANNQPAFGYYLPGPNSSLWQASGLIVLTLSQDQIAVITRFGDKGILARFGLPRDARPRAIVTTAPLADHCYSWSLRAESSPSRAEGAPRRGDVDISRAHALV